MIEVNKDNPYHQAAKNGRMLGQLAYVIVPEGNYNPPEMAQKLKSAKSVIEGNPELIDGHFFLTIRGRLPGVLGQYLARIGTLVGVREFNTLMTKAKQSKHDGVSPADPSP